MRCDECGHEMNFGEWPFCPHDKAEFRPPFVPWIDENIAPHPVEIRSLAQWNRLMKENKCVLKDKPSAGAMAARRDWCMETEREKRKCQ